MVLCHDGSHIQLINVCKDESKKQWNNLPPKEDEDLQQFIALHRQVFDVKHQQALFIGLVWVWLVEQKFFEHFSEVICVDIVSDTNNDKLQLLTISAKIALVRCLSSKEHFYQTEGIGDSNGSSQ